MHRAWAIESFPVEPQYARRGRLVSTKVLHRATDVTALELLHAHELGRIVSALVRRPWMSGRSAFFALPVSAASISGDTSVGTTCPGPVWPARANGGLFQSRAPVDGHEEPRDFGEVHR